GSVHEEGDVSCHGGSRKIDFSEDRRWVPAQRENKSTERPCFCLTAKFRGSGMILIRARLWRAWRRSDDGGNARTTSAPRLCRLWRGIHSAASWHEGRNRAPDHGPHSHSRGSAAPYGHHLRMVHLCWR